MRILLEFDTIITMKLINDKISNKRVEYWYRWVMTSSKTNLDLDIITKILWINEWHALKIIYSMDMYLIILSCKKLL
jgi:hypothetical protein